MYPPLKGFLKQTTRLRTFWKIQLNKLALDLFQLFPLHKLKATIVAIIEQMFYQEIFACDQGNCECFCIECLVYLFLDQHFNLSHYIYNL
jgi:hypothetical protein